MAIRDFLQTWKPKEDTLPPGWAIWLTLVIAGFFGVPVSWQSSGHVRLWGDDSATARPTPVVSASSSNYDQSLFQSGRRFSGLFVVTVHGPPFPNTEHITLVNPNGSTVATVGTGHGPFVNPRWSPDGQRLAFVSESDGDFDVFVMNADGTHVVNLTDSRFLEFYPAWSPDGTEIAFTRTPEAHGAMRTYIVKADGSGIEILPTTFHFQATDWSPDSKWLVGRGGFTGTNQIIRVRRDGSEWKIISTGSGQPLADARWSPNGSLIVWSRNAPQGEIMIVGVDGDGERALVNTPGNDLFPFWSPDGSRVLFWSNGELLAVSVDGTGLVRVFALPRLSFAEVQKLPLFGQAFLPVLAAD